jgi:hypothetical protein
MLNRGCICFRARRERKFCKASRSYSVSGVASSDSTIFTVRPGESSTTVLLLPLIFLPAGAIIHRLALLILYSYTVICQAAVHRALRYLCTAVSTKRLCAPVSMKRLQLPRRSDWKKSMCTRAYLTLGSCAWLFKLEFPFCQALTTAPVACFSYNALNDCESIGSCNLTRLASRACM